MRWRSPPAGLPARATQCASLLPGCQPVTMSHIQGPAEPRRTPELRRTCDSRAWTSFLPLLAVWNVGATVDLAAGLVCGVFESVADALVWTEPDSNATFTSLPTYAFSERGASRLMRMTAPSATSNALFRLEKSRRSSCGCSSVRVSQAVRPSMLVGSIGAVGAATSAAKVVPVKRTAPTAAPSSHGQLEHAPL